MKSITVFTLLLTLCSLSHAEPPPSLNKKEASKAITETYTKLVEAHKKQRASELQKQTITIAQHSLKWLEKTFGEAPADGRSLWISLHGGGGAPPAVNDQQWRNQIRLYQPKEGIYLAPRAPTNTWNLWHQAHIDPLFERLIENFVALRGVNPDKIYILGYSAGGDGVWQIAPRMADRFASAATMAGHPNESSLLGLRNLPFAIFMGGADAAYDRNKIAAQKTAKIAKLKKQDPKGYTHLSRIYPGLPHWMNGKDAEAIPWMAQHKRQAWPIKIVWLQDDVIHRRFYWLELPPAHQAKAGQKITAEVTGQSISLKGDIPKGLRLLLSDQLIDLDKPITVRVNQRASQTYQPKRQQTVINSTLKQRLDTHSAASAVITVD